MKMAETVVDEWTGACSDPSSAEKCMDLFQNIILFTREQSLTGKMAHLAKIKR